MNITEWFHATLLVVSAIASATALTLLLNSVVDAMRPLIRRLSETPEA